MASDNEPRKFFEAPEVTVGGSKMSLVLSTCTCTCIMFLFQ